MKRNDHQSPAWFDDAFGRLKCRCQFAEFIVDEDAQRLKRTRRRMDVVRTRAHDRRNSVGERARCFKRSIRARLDDRARDGARVTLFPEDENDVGEITLARLVEDIGSARTLASHAHVEWAIKAE